jgi:hypothetical protein
MEPRDFFSIQRAQSTTENRSEAIADLINGCERAVFDHYFAEVYPREIRERARHILRLAEWLDERARSGSLGALDELSCLLLPPFEDAAQQCAEMRQRLRNFRGRL